MAFNGAGTFNPPAPPVYPAVSGNLINSAYFNTLMQEIFVGLSTALTKDGQTAPVSNLPMGGFRHTGVSDATASDQYASYGQLLAISTGVRYSVVDQGAVGDNVADDYTAIQATINLVFAAGGGVVFFPKPSVAYAYGTGLELKPGVRLEGPGFAFGWLTTVQPVRLRYTGATVAVRFTPAAAAQTGSAQIAGLVFDGVDSSAGTIGLHLDATAAGSSLLNVLCENASFINFPRNQVKHSDVVFNVTYRDCTFLNPSRTMTDACVKVVDATGNNPSQITFDNCYTLQYTTALWCYDIAGQDVRFIGGTIAPYDGGTGAHGAKISGGLHLVGTHVEGPLNTQGTTIGIQYSGSNGATINPSQLAYFGRGIVIGNPADLTESARGWTIAGQVGNNNVLVTPGTTCDIEILGGPGSRVGTIVGTGFGNGSPTIIDRRRITDGVPEVLYLYEGKAQGLLQGRAGSAAAPGVSVGDAGNHGLYDIGGGAMGVSAGGVKVAEVRSTDIRHAVSFYPANLAGGTQVNGRLWFTTGVPSNALGGDGDFVINTTGGAMTTGYLKATGSWAARF